MSDPSRSELSGDKPDVPPTPPVELSREALELIDSAGSITIAYRKMRDGDQDGLARIINHFQKRLLSKVRKTIPAKLRVDYGSGALVDDAVLSFWNAIKAGRSLDIENRQDIERLLVTIVFFKSIKRRKHAEVQVRGGAKPKPVPDPRQLSKDEYERQVREQLADMRDGDKVHRPAAEGWAIIDAPEPGPAECQDYEDLCEHLVHVLPEDGSLRAIGRTWLRDCLQSASEIREQLHLTIGVHSVQIKLKTVREILRPMLEQLYDLHSS